MARTKVFWNNAEWAKLAHAAAPLIRKGWSRLEAYRYSQGLIFAQDRQRPLASNDTIREGMPFLEIELRGLGDEHAAPGPVARERPKPAPTGAVPAWMEAQIEEEARRQAERLRNTYQQRVSERVKALLAEPAAPRPGGGQPAPAAAPVAQQSAETAAGHHRPRHDPEPPQVRERLPRVVLVGVWPQLRAVINKEFAETLDLRWFDNNKNDFAVIERAARNAALAMVPDAIHGEIPNMLRRAAPKFESVHGSASAMVDRLTKFVVYGK